MPPPGRIRTVAAVRVVIEFASVGRWSGRLRTEPDPTVDAAFEGRLELLRLLDALAGHERAEPHTDR